VKINVFLVIYFSEVSLLKSQLKIKPKFRLSRQSSNVYRIFVRGRGYHLWGDPLSGLGDDLGSSLRSWFLSWLGGWLGSWLGG
jgi:hypothetical protein